MKKIDLKGKTLGELIIISDTPERKNGQIVWKCKCSCGNEHLATYSTLKKSNHPNCGCKYKELLRKTSLKVKHGASETPEYSRWSDMRARCNTPSSSVYKYYGGRGIKVCKRWDSFENFSADMGALPTPKHTLERNDPDGDYTPKNCYWMIGKRQARNTRKTLRDAMGVALIDRNTDLPHTTVTQRVTRLGYDAEEALTKPKFHNGPIPMPERKHSRHSPKKR